MKTALFTGTFNPFTIGHADIVERSLTLFDKVVIGIGYNPEKATSDIEERVAAIQRVYKDNPRVTVEAYNDLTVELAKRHNASAIVKGVRSVKDFEYEREQAEFNKLLGDGLETVLFFAKPELTAISSTTVRQLKQFGKDITPFLP
ncbi:MAG: pantetheine-phosphate adenylyltransferase [Prevotella sp.]|nr:pantetheine-phosphate adenylyltransferase [Candidatus Prevotella equi]